MVLKERGSGLSWYWMLSLESGSKKTWLSGEDDGIDKGASVASTGAMAEEGGGEKVPDLREVAIQVMNKSALVDKEATMNKEPSEREEGENGFNL